MAVVGSPPLPRGASGIRVVVLGLALAALVTLFVTDRMKKEDAATASVAAPIAATATTVAAAPVDPALREVDAQPQSLEGCTVDGTLRYGSTGASVSCLQVALATAGVFTGAPTGEFGSSTFQAVEALQKQKDLFVDGVVGRETELALDIWPDEQSFVIRTPKPAPGATDSMGYPLSSVASTGASAPPLPANSGTGRRVVYERKSQRVWAVAKDGTIIRSWLVSGSKFNNEVPGVHKVYSRSEVSTAWNGKAKLPMMIRWYQTSIGHIGFHGIPVHVSDGSPYQTEDELGTRLSGGCQRQSNKDARFLWDFAQVGTPIVVL
jgi:peptidoglycan hydrolase-like protein with peptidoglycan-binding domain